MTCWYRFLPLYGVGQKDIKVYLISNKDSRVVSSQHLLTNDTNLADLIYWSSSSWLIVTIFYKSVNLSTNPPGLISTEPNKSIIDNNFWPWSNVLSTLTSSILCVSLLVTLSISIIPLIPWSRFLGDGRKLFSRL